MAKILEKVQFRNLEMRSAHLKDLKSTFFNLLPKYVCVLVCIIHRNIFILRAYFGAVIFLRTF